MTTMKAEALRAQDSDELGTRLKAARRELYELRFKGAVGQLEDHRQIRKVRKDIAKILTVIHERELFDVEPVAVEAASSPTSVGEVPAKQAEGPSLEAEPTKPRAARKKKEEEETE